MGKEGRTAAVLPIIDPTVAAPRLPGRPVSAPRAPVLGLILLLLIAGGHVSSLRARSQGIPSLLIVKNATLTDGLSADSVDGATVVVRDGRIESVTVGPVVTPAGATIFDLKERWLLPGLIDAHTHLRDLKTARALATGVTTARSLGTERLTDVGIRDLNHAGVVDLPDAVAAGYQVRAALGDGFFLDFPQMIDLMPGVHGTEAVRRIVRALAGRGVNVIKVMATERTALARADPLRRVFTDDELSAITDEGRKLGLPVAAHSYGVEGTDAAVRAGVRTIEHGADLSDGTLSLMQKRGICSWMPNEMGELVSIGMSPMEAIKSATSTAAFTRARGDARRD